MTPLYNETHIQRDGLRNGSSLAVWPCHTPKDMRMNKTDVARPLAWSIAALSVALVVIDLAINILAGVQSHGQGRLAPDVLSSLYSSMTTITYILVGALVASRHPHNSIGWI